LRLVNESVIAKIKEGSDAGKFKKLVKVLH